MIIVSYNVYLVVLGRVRCTFFFFHDSAASEIYTLSLHDALPISGAGGTSLGCSSRRGRTSSRPRAQRRGPPRSEEHTSELQSRLQLVCRLLLEKKNTGKG